jgi:hypothetical protein
MHETKSPHMNHIHQHKSHNTIDLDLQSLYSISIKGITMIVCSKLFSQNSKLKMRGEAHLFIQEGRMASSRRAHQVVDMGCQVWRVRAPLLHTNQACVNQKLKQGMSATSPLHRLPPQEGATSPRGAHLLSHMCSNLMRSPINQVPIT